MGPGYFRIPAGCEIGIRIRQSDDGELAEIIREVQSCPSLTHLNLSENRKITDEGLECIESLKALQELNLSSCDITNDVFGLLKKMVGLKILNLSFCPRIGDEGLKLLRNCRRLEYLDLQGCPRITRAGLAKVERAGLTIHKHK